MHETHNAVINPILNNISITLDNPNNDSSNLMEAIESLLCDKIITITSKQYTEGKHQRNRNIVKILVQSTLTLTLLSNCDFKNDIIALKANTPIPFDLEIEDMDLLRITREITIRVLTTSTNGVSDSATLNEQQQESRYITTSVLASTTIPIDHTGETSGSLRISELTNTDLFDCTLTITAQTCEPQQSLVVQNEQQQLLYQIVQLQHHQYMLVPPMQYPPVQQQQQHKKEQEIFRLNVNVLRAFNFSKHRKQAAENKVLHFRYKPPPQLQKDSYNETEPSNQFMSSQICLQDTLDSLEQEESTFAEFSSKWELG